MISNDEKTTLEYNKILSEFSLLTTEDLNEKLLVDSSFPGVILYADALNRHFVKFDDGGIIDIPVPQSLVDRIYQAASMGADVTPMFKLWMRWCRNPILRKKRKDGKGDDFAKSLAQTAAEKGTGQTARAAKVGAQSLAGLAAAISRQVQPCANRITNPGPGANRIKSRINLQRAKDGSLTARPTLMGQTGVDDENGRYAQRVGELAAAAIIQCAPFELPDELYEGGWKNITINYKLPG